jgi:hypothetical protein
VIYQEKPVASSKNDEALMTNDKTIQCKSRLLFNKLALVADESGVATTALPPQSKIAMGWCPSRETMKLRNEAILTM